MQVKQHIDLSFLNKQAFCRLIDSLPTSGTQDFKCELLEITGDIIDVTGQPQKTTVELWKRCPIELIKEIIGNPALNGKLHYEPVRIYNNPEKQERIYNEAYTADWWWNLQVCHASIEICFTYKNYPS